MIPPIPLGSHSSRLWVVISGPQRRQRYTRSCTSSTSCFRLDPSTQEGCNDDGVARSGQQLCAASFAIIHRRVRLSLEYKGSHVGQITFYFDHLDPKLPLRDGMSYRIRVVHIQRRKDKLDRAEYAAPTRQHELDHMRRSVVYPPCKV